MATLDSLDFEVILKSDTFVKQIAQVQGLANTFNTTMSQALALTGIKGGSQSVQELTRALNDATKAQRGLNAAVRESPSEKITIRQGRAISEVNSRLYASARLLRTIKALTGGAFSIIGIRRFLSTMIRVTGEFEVQKMALRTILQDIDAADKIFQDLYRFSSDSTYRFSELAKHAKQLAAFNIEKNSLLETTKMLGDVASGVGVSMDRLILAYGHVKSSGFLRGIQLRSFSQNGVPVLDELAKMFTEIEGRAVSLGEVFDKMMKREIPFEMVEEAFKRMTSEGGKFYKMQEVLSKTLAGQINILKGRWENMMYAIGQSQDGILKGAVSKISGLIANYEEVGKLLRQVIMTFGIYKATLIGLEVATNTFTVANHRMLTSLKNMAKFAYKNPYVILAAAIAAATFAAVRYLNTISDTEKITKALSDTTKKYETTVNAEIRELDLLYGALKSAKKGTQEYNSARLAIEKRFSPYIEKLRSEGVAVNNLATIYDHLSEKIKNANKERFLEEAQAGITSAYGEAEKRAEAEIKALLPRIANTIGRAVTPDEEGAIRHYIRSGGMNDVFKNLEKEITAGRERVTMLVYDASGQATSQTVEAAGKQVVDAMNEVKNNLDIASLTYQQAMMDASKRFDAINREIAGDNGGDQMVYKISSVVEGIKKIDREINQIRTKARNGSITESEKSQLEELIKDRESQANLYKSIMGVDYDKDMKAGSKAADEAVRTEISNLEKEATLLRKYKEVYDSLAPILGDSTKSALESLFGKKFSDTSFDSQLDSIIEKMAELGDEGERAAESLRALLGKDTASQISKSLEAQNKTAEMLREYIERSFDIEGEGIAAQISKILVDLTNKNIKADEKLEQFIEELDKSEIFKKLEYKAKNADFFEHFGFDEKRQEAAAEVYWQKWREEQIRVWREQLAREKQANEKLSKEQIVGKADDLFKRMTGGLDLTNFNDKTVRQLRAMRNELQRMTFPADVAEILDPETLERFADILAKMQENEIAKIDQAMLEKQIAGAQKLLRAFQGIGDSVAQIGEALHNSTLTEVGKILSMTEELVSVIAENESLLKSCLSDTENAASDVGDIVQSADWITMIIKSALIIVKNIAGAIEEDYERQKTLNDATAEYRETLRDIVRLRDEGYFGDDELGLLADNWKIAADAAQVYKDTVAKDTGAATGVGGINFMGVESVKYTYNSLRGLASRFPELFDIAGNLNAEYLKSMIEVFKKGGGFFSDSGWWNISGDLEVLVEEIVSAYDAMMDATQQFAASVKGIFGSLADTIANDFVDSFLETGDALSNLDKSFEKFGESVARSMLKSLLSSKMMEKFGDNIDKMAEDYVAALASSDRESADMQFAEMIAGLAGEMREFAEGYGAFANEFLSNLQQYGLLGEGEESESTLANGIKGITEDTANLLASYLNAVRADVSYIRMMEEIGWRDVNAISAAIPTLNDYMAQVAASNANIAESNRQILERIDRLTTTSTGRAALAVDVQ